MEATASAALQGVEPAVTSTAVTVAVPMAMAVAAPPVVVVNAFHVQPNDASWESNLRATAVVSLGAVRSSVQYHKKHKGKSTWQE